jgi:hypothetical protein
MMMMMMPMMMDEVRVRGEMGGLMDGIGWFGGRMEIEWGAGGGEGGRFWLRSQKICVGESVNKGDAENGRRGFG